MAFVFFLFILKTRCILSPETCTRRDIVCFDNLVLTFEMKWGSRHLLHCRRRTDYSGSEAAGNDVPQIGQKHATGSYVGDASS